MRTSHFIVISIAVLALCSCNKGDQGISADINANIVGKWKATRLEGSEIATNDCMVFTYQSKTKSLKSSSYNGEGSYWMNKLPFTCGINGSVITEINVASSPSNIFETTVSEIDRQIMTASVKHTRGTAVASERNLTFTKITADYGDSILGTWEGTEITGTQTYGDANHRWEFLSNGTFNYYSLNTNKEWVREADKESEYIIDGNWLATYWKDASDKVFYECWDITQCDASAMKWSAKRKDGAGRLSATTLTLKKVGEAPQDKDIYTLASFNIRCDTSSDTGDKDWSTSRKTLVSRMVKSRNFDVCGFVEVTQSLMANDLKSLLGDTYSFKLCGRNNGGSSGEAVGFGYKTDKFTLTSSGYFFLNTHPSTPGEASEWADPADTYNRSRLATWGLLKDKNTDKQLLYIVSHFELNKGMRAGSAKLIVQKAKELAPAGVPVFFCGDLNAAPTEASCCDTLARYFNDSYDYAVAKNLPREGQITTYNGYNSSVGKATVSKRIDYMYYRGDNVTLKKYGVIYDLIDGKLPSDHYPIYISVALK